MIVLLMMFIMRIELLYLVFLLRLLIVSLQIVGQYGLRKMFMYMVVQMVVMLCMLIVYVSSVMYRMLQMISILVGLMCFIMSVVISLLMKNVKKVVSRQCDVLCLVRLLICIVSWIVKFYMLICVLMYRNCVMMFVMKCWLLNSCVSVLCVLIWCVIVFVLLFLQVGYGVSVNMMNIVMSMMISYLYGLSVVWIIVS